MEKELDQIWIPIKGESNPAGPFFPSTSRVFEKETNAEISRLKI